MANDNVMAALAQLDKAGPFGYRSADVADFNQLSEGGCFAAYCTVIIRGEYQRAAVPDPQYLWGTRDPGTPNTGWSISIEAAGGQAAIVGRVGTGGAVSDATYAFSLSNKPSFVERAMQIGLFYVPEGDGLVYLTLNGSVIAVSAEAAAPFAPSAFPVSCGISPVTPAAEGADLIDVVACGYSYNFEVSDVDDVGFYAAHAFNDERGACGGGTVFNDIGLDWVHRYKAATLGVNLPASITKQPARAQLRPDAFPNPLGYASVPVSATWQDLGNLIGPTPGGTPVAYNPVNLNRIGPLFTGGFVTQPALVGRKNVDWYASSAYVFPEA